MIFLFGCFENINVKSLAVRHVSLYCFSLYKNQFAITLCYAKEEDQLRRKGIFMLEGILRIFPLFCFDKSDTAVALSYREGVCSGDGVRSSHMPGRLQVPLQNGSWIVSPPPEGSKAWPRGRWMNLNPMKRIQKVAKWELNHKKRNLGMAKRSLVRLNSGLGEEELSLKRIYPVERMEGLVWRAVVRIIVSWWM